MKFFEAALALMALVLVGETIADLPPPERPYNILMLMPVCSKSHRNVFMPLATALTKRGHKITMLSNLLPYDNNPDITYLEHGLSTFDEDRQNMFETASDPDKMFKMFSELFPMIARELYKDPVVKELYKKKDQFDVVIIDQIFNEVTYPFAYKKPFITLSTSAMDPTLSAIMGNLQNPAYVSSMLDDYPQPFSFVNRVKNLFLSITVPYRWRGAILNPTEVEMLKQFPELPPISEIERNQSLNLINGHFTTNHVLPLLPNQVEVGGMHLRPPKPLPKDIESFLSGNTPVIYFSLGSIARSTTIPPKHKEMLLSAFAKLPYKLLWKYEEDFPNLPKNILIQKWMPQIDILAHPNVKVFISHCGLLGSQEAMYHGKPMLGLPIYGDQPKNAKSLEHRGIGRFLLWKDLSEQLIIDNVKELVENPSYAAAMVQVSKTYKDQLDSPVDRAVYWTEYVIRHDGATHLRSPERDLSWIQVLHLDILFMMHVTFFLLYKLVCKMLGLCFGSKKTKPQQKKNKRE